MMAHLIYPSYVYEDDKSMIYEFAVRHRSAGLQRSNYIKSKNGIVKREPLMIIQCKVP